jgi:4'-phosphopantetheinyl transferase EntD
LIIEILAVIFQLQKVIFSLTESIFKAVIEFPLVGCFNNMGKETEVISESEQGVFMDFNLALIVKVSKDPSVLP